MEAVKAAAEYFFEGLRALNDGDLNRAEMGFLKALELAPDRPSVLTNLSIVYTKQNKLVQASELVQKALEKDSTEPLYWLQSGVVQLKLGDYNSALNSLTRALEKNPSLAEGHNNLGGTLKELNRLDDALASYDRAVSLDPGYAEAHSNRGIVLKELNRLDESLASHDKAISLKPDYAEAYSARGIVLKELGRLDEALASYDKAISLKPISPEAYNNRGFVLEELSRLDEALASFDKAISLKPDYVEAYSNRGLVLKDLNRLDEALASYDEALKVNPDDHGAKVGKSFLLLQRGSFLDGFELQLSRWYTGDLEVKAPNTTVPLWDGSSIDGEVLLWAEQGIGDEVFFASMLSLLPEREQRVSLSADLRLHPIYARSFPDLQLIDRKLTKTQIPAGYSAQAPIGNLGHLLGVNEDTLAKRKYPYLIADPHRKSQLRTSYYPSKERCVCGIAWKSGNKEFGGPRSIDLVDCAPLWACPEMEFVNLQYGDVAGEIALVRQRFGREIDVVPEVDVFNDIDGLLALIDMCDVVFTIDNVTAHLAGAIGKKSVVLVPLGSGRYWYWGADSPSQWYPSLNLVYQKQVGDWTSAIEDATLLVKHIAGS
jgi:tetratricopeptide (TPR) repeat protein